MRRKLMMESNKLTPKHIAIIMDGNGRWASKKGEQRLYGHSNGVNSVREVIEGCADNSVKYLTLYAFSTENWGRPKDEVDGLMTLFCSTITQEVESLVEKGVRLRFMGRINELSSDVQENIYIAEELTKNNTMLTVIIALNYSSKIEICDMVKSIAEKVKNGAVDISEINQNMIDNNLYINDIPNPDLLIRTSGEKRISNFLLWQIAYTELYFTTVLWPDFNKKELNKAIEEYKNRNRRYGLVIE